MKKFMFLIPSLIIVFSVSCCQGQKDSPANEGEVLHRVFAQYQQWILSRHPEWAAYLGDKSKAGEMDDSIKGIEKDYRHVVKELDKLQSMDRSLLSEKDKFYYDLYQLHLEFQIKSHRFKEHLRPINQRPDSIHLKLIAMASFSVFNTEKNYRDFLSKLSVIPRIVDEISERMKLGVEEKITFPKQAVHAVAGQLASVLVDDPTRTALFEPFTNIPKNLQEETKKELKNKARDIITEKVIPAFRKLHKYWTEEYYPNCRETLGHSSLPNGADWYKYLIKFYTTTDLSAYQIHQIGLEEVARIRQEMNKIIKEVGFKGTFAEFVHFLKTDPQFYYTKSEDLLTAYRALCKQINPELPKIIGYRGIISSFHSIWKKRTLPFSVSWIITMLIPKAGHFTPRAWAMRWDSTLILTPGLGSLISIC